MCDCYWQECATCKTEIPVHIQDFSFPRTDVQVFCLNHLPKERATIFKVMKSGMFAKEEKAERKGYKCAIRLCDGKIEPESAGVCPNIGAIYKIEIVIKKEEK